MATTYPIYWISSSDASEKMGGFRSLSNAIPEDTRNNTMTGETIGFCATYHGAQKIGHLVVPDGVQHKIVNDRIEITKQSVIDGASTTWTYDINELVREGSATETSKGRKKPYIVTLKG